MTITKNLVDENKYYLKCPNAMKPTRIVVHETANDASARNEISYMRGNNLESSFHFAIDDKEIVQGIPLDRNAWHAGDGNGKGNREGIAIEICYSKSGGEKWLASLHNAAKFIAELLKERNWGVDKVTKHQDYSGKNCPHRILGSYGWNNFISLVSMYLTDEKPTQKENIDVFYQVWDVEHKKWLPIVKNLEDYAGIYGNNVCCLYANLSKGNILYKVHTKGGRWLPEVRNREDYAGLFNKAIDGLMMRTDTEKTIHYAVHLKNRNKWLPFVTGYNTADSNNGFAGIIGQEIDGVKIYID